MLYHLDEKNLQVFPLPNRIPDSSNQLEHLKVKTEFLFLHHFEENLLRSANHIGQIIFCWYTEQVLEHSLVYLPSQYCDISDISLQPNLLCVSLCGEAEICLPNIPAAAPAMLLLHSQTQNVGWCHAAKSSCCVSPWRKLHYTCCEKGSSPSSAHWDPAILWPLCCGAGPVHALTAGTE